MPCFVWPASDARSGCLRALQLAPDLSAPSPTQTFQYSLSYLPAIVHANGNAD
jgi:hypothetical protein